MNDDDSYMQKLKDYLEGSLFGVSRITLLQARKYVFEIISKQSHKDCLYLLSLFYAAKWGVVEKDDTEAFRLSKMSANLGSSWGALSVGYWFQVIVLISFKKSQLGKQLNFKPKHGTGTQKDVCQGFASYLKSHKMGNHHATFNLAVTSCLQKVSDLIF